MTWIKYIIQILGALPKIITLVGSLISSWKEAAADKKQKDAKEKIRDEHQDLRDGDTPRRD